MEAYRSRVEEGEALSRKLRGSLAEAQGRALQEKVVRRAAYSIFSWLSRAARQYRNRTAAAVSTIAHNTAGVCLSVVVKTKVTFFFGDCDVFIHRGRQSG